MDLEVGDYLATVSRANRSPDRKIHAVAGESDGTICHLQMDTADMFAARGHRCSQSGKKAAGSLIGAIDMQVTVLTMGPRSSHEQRELACRTVDVHCGTQGHRFGRCCRLRGAKKHVRDRIYIRKIAIRQTTFAEGGRVA